MLFPLLAAGLLAATPTRLPAGPPVAAGALPGGPHALRFDWTRDGILTAAGLLFWVSSETFLKAPLAPDRCRWCDRDASGASTLNGLDRWARGIGVDSAGGQRLAARTSDVLNFGVLPAGLFGLHHLVAGEEGSTRVLLEDAVIVLQSAALALTTTQVVKSVTGRQRPFAHALPPGERPPPPDPSDFNLSFFSGHTSQSFSLAVSAGVVAHLRGYERPWLPWAVGLPVATSVALLRMAAQKHYLTDVLAAAATGSAFGVAVPLLLHGRLAPEGAGGSLQVRVMPGGAALDGTW